MNEALLVYTHVCPDGIAAAAIALAHLQSKYDNIFLHETSYAHSTKVELGNIHSLCFNRDVYIVGFQYSKLVLTELAKASNKIVMLYTKDGPGNLAGITQDYYYGIPRCTVLQDTTSSRVLMSYQFFAQFSSLLEDRVQVLLDYVNEYASPDELSCAPLFTEQYLIPGETIQSYAIHDIAEWLTNVEFKSVYNLLLKSLAAHRAIKLLLNTQLIEAPMVPVIYRDSRNDIGTIELPMVNCPHSMIFLLSSAAAHPMYLTWELYGKREIKVTVVGVLKDLSLTAHDIASGYSGEGSSRQASFNLTFKQFEKFISGKYSPFNRMLDSVLTRVRRGRTALKVWG